MSNVFILSFQVQTLLYFSLLRAAVTILLTLLFCKLGVYSVVRRFRPLPRRQKTNGKNHPCSCGGSKIRSELTYFQPWVTAKCCTSLWWVQHHLGEATIVHEQWGGVKQPNKGNLYSFFQHTDMCDCTPHVICHILWAHVKLWVAAVTNYFHINSFN